ncbi:hypothetical protein ACFL4N_10015 [Thermodesulfobacteriota bacterium]
MDRTKIKERISAFVALLLLVIFGWFIWWLFTTAWSKLSSLDSNLAIGVLTAATTVIVAALTVSLGRYFERKKEIEAHFRERKVEIYDEFLHAFFKIFAGDDTAKPDENDLVSFLREWQRKMILWGGSNVLSAYMKWNTNLRKGEPNAQSVFLMEAFFKAIRKDLGLSNRGLGKGIFSHLMLKNAELFLQEAKENPNITLAELGEIEEKLGLNK